MELTIDACEDYKAADLELNSVYQQVLKAHGDDKLFQDALKDAQRAWVKFRDAEMKALYPEPNKRFMYGSVYPMCECGALAKLTRERTATLSEWLTQQQEGDVCSGSK